MLTATLFSDSVTVSEYPREANTAVSPNSTPPTSGLPAAAGLSLEQIESIHPNMYNTEEKITFIEGRESRSTENIQDRVRECRHNLVRTFDEQQAQKLVPHHQAEVEEEMVRQEQEYHFGGQEVLRVEQEINNRSEELLYSQDLHNRTFVCTETKGIVSQRSDPARSYNVSTNNTITHEHRSGK